MDPDVAPATAERPEPPVPADPPAFHQRGLLGDPGRRDPARRPGPGARRLCGPRFVSVLSWTAGVVLGVVIAVSSVATGEAGGVVLGLALCAGAGALLFLVLNTQVHLDGSRLHSRTGAGCTPVVDLDRLTYVRLAVSSSGIPFRRGRPILIELQDAHGVAIRIDARNVDQGPRLREIGARGLTFDVDPETRGAIERASRD